MSAIQSVLPASMTSADPAAAASDGRAPARSVSPAAPLPPAVAQPPIALTLAAKRAALGDSELPESSRRYLMVDVSAIKRRRPPQLCYFNIKYSVGRILDQICEEASVENKNHLAGRVGCILLASASAQTRWHQTSHCRRCMEYCWTEIPSC